MNCPAKTDPIVSDGHNQNPYMLASDLTTRADLGKLANARQQRNHSLRDPVESENPESILQQQPNDEMPGPTQVDGAKVTEKVSSDEISRSWSSQSPVERPRLLSVPAKVVHVLKTYLKFVGPGFMIAVAYIDPGNYATDVDAGASYRYSLLFVVLLSNIFAIFLQTLCINLGTVTGMNLAEMMRAHLPPWLNYTLWFFGEAAIIATDMAEVIGTAIALYLLSNGKIPLVAGCAISIVDVLFILIFYRQNGASMKAKRAFEFFVALLVIGVAICFCIQLSYIGSDVTAGEVFRGYLPSSTLVKGQALYQSCGIVGATVMPHSIYLGSGLVQDRLQHFDKTHNLLSNSTPSDTDEDDAEKEPYRPSLRAIRSCTSYSIAELAVQLFTFALFINSGILIVAGSSLYHVGGAAEASLFGVYHLLSTSLAPAAGKIFAVALLLSGTSAGIICTMAGQMVSEGQLRLKMAPWKRRFLVRTFSIVPSIIIAGSLGKDGIAKALVGSQVALSIVLPIVSAPLIWFTCFGKYMTVTADRCQDLVFSEGAGGMVVVEGREVNMRKHWLVAVIAVLIWIFLVMMNVAAIVFLGMGKS